MSDCLQLGIKAVFRLEAMYTERLRVFEKSFDISYVFCLKSSGNFTACSITEKGRYL